MGLSQRKSKNRELRSHHPVTLQAKEMLLKGLLEELGQETSAQAGGNWSSEDSPSQVTLCRLLHVSEPQVPLVESGMLVSTSPALCEGYVQRHLLQGDGLGAGGHK